MYRLVKKNERMLPRFASFGYLDSLFNNFWDGLGPESFAVAAAPNIKLTEDDDNYYVQAELPGVLEEDIALQYEDGILSLQAEPKEETRREDERIIYNELRARTYSRSFRIPDIDAEKIEAKLTGGVLSVRLPKQEEKKPKQIKIATK